MAHFVSNVTKCDFGNCKMCLLLKVNTINRDFTPLGTILMVTNSDVTWFVSV